MWRDGDRREVHSHSQALCSGLSEALQQGLGQVCSQPQLLRQVEVILSITKQSKIQDRQFCIVSFLTIIISAEKPMTTRKTVRQFTQSRTCSTMKKFVTMISPFWSSNDQSMTALMLKTRPGNAGQ